MPQAKNSVINIGIVGGGGYCVEILNKYAVSLDSSEYNARITAVADENENAPGILLAKKLGLKTVLDFHDLFNPALNIQLLIVLIPDRNTLDEVINSRPPHVRILSYTAFLFLWRDISDIDAELKEQKEEMETILNHIQDFIVVITPEMRIVEANKAFLENMGYSRQEVIGQKCHEIFQKKNRQCYLSDTICPLNNVIRNKNTTHRVDLIRRDHDGRIRHMDVMIFPIWEKNGKISKFIEISRDITAIKRRQDEITAYLEEAVKKRTAQLEETHAKLLHQDKMFSLGKLAATVVHEINNPIAGILNLTMLLQRISKEDSSLAIRVEEFNQYLALIETETRRVSRIVSNLLSFSRQSKSEMRRFDINALFEKVLLLNSNLLKINGINVKRALNTNLPVYLGSEDQFQQVFMNLLSNAIEAMEKTEKKELTIETDYLLASNTILISIADTGIGVASDNYLKLFEPFFTTKKKGKGVGLGLSVAYGIIENHGGIIDLESRLNEGTLFKIKLPLDSVRQPPQIRKKQAES